MSKLSERVRPDVEAAPWVVEEIKKLEAERDALAARVQEMREAIVGAYDYVEDAIQTHLSSYGENYKPHRIEYMRGVKTDCDKALLTPDTSAQILARRDAAIWWEAAEACDRQALYFDKAMMSSTSHGSAKCRDALRAKGEAILKGLEKEHG